MIIKAGTEEGKRAVIYDKDGNMVDLFIKSYNTETREAEYYLLDENGMLKMSDWEHDKNEKGLPVGTRTPITEKKVLEGAYAEIDGVKV